MTFLLTESLRCLRTTTTETTLTPAQPHRLVPCCQHPQESSESSEYLISCLSGSIQIKFSNIRQKQGLEIEIKFSFRKIKMLHFYIPDFTTWDSRLTTTIILQCPSQIWPLPWNLSRYFPGRNELFLRTYLSCVMDWMFMPLTLPPNPNDSIRKWGLWEIISLWGWSRYEWNWCPYRRGQKASLSLFQLCEHTIRS